MMRHYRWRQSHGISARIPTTACQPSIPGIQWRSCDRWQWSCNHIQRSCDCLTFELLLCSLRRPLWSGRVSDRLTWVEELVAELKDHESLASVQKTKQQERGCIRSLTWQPPVHSCQETHRIWLPGDSSLCTSRPYTCRWRGSGYLLPVPVHPPSEAYSCK